MRLYIKPDHKLTSLAQLALYMDRTTMRFNKVLTDSQA